MKLVKNKLPALYIWILSKRKTNEYVAAIDYGNGFWEVKISDLNFSECYPKLRCENGTTVYRLCPPHFPFNECEGSPRIATDKAKDYKGFYYKHDDTSCYHYWPD